MKVELTDEMLRAGLDAMKPDRIQGFSTPGEGRKSWGAPHYVLDTWRKRGEQEIWRGTDSDEMIERCAMEELRLGIEAALSSGQDGGK